MLFLGEFLNAHRSEETTGGAPTSTLASRWRLSPYLVQRPAPPATPAEVLTRAARLRYIGRNPEEAHMESGGRWWQTSRDLIEQIRKRREQAAQRKRESRRDLRDSLAIAIAILAALFTGWQAYEAHEARVDADRAARTARQDAKDAADQARKASEKGLQVQLDAVRKAEVQAGRSAEAAESSASTASQALHVSERAYIYMTPSLRKPPSSGEKLQISVVIGNSGRTPALEMAVHCGAAFVPISTPVNEALERAFAAPAQKWQSVSVLPSGGTSESPSDSPLALNQSDVEQLMADKMSLYVFATTTYKDVFKQPHHTEICTIYQPKLNAFMNCHEHNKSD
jgi:hypothetical protein